MTSDNIYILENLGRISKDDPRWISGEIISSCIGSKKAKKDLTSNL